MLGVLACFLLVAFVRIVRPLLYSRPLTKTQHTGAGAHAHVLDAVAATAHQGGNDDEVYTTPMSTGPTFAPAVAFAPPLGDGDESAAPLPLEFVDEFEVEVEVIDVEIELEMEGEGQQAGTGETECYRVSVRAVS